jgi:ribosomal protein S18 acetylase RimI-like enzyme
MKIIGIRQLQFSDCQIWLDMVRDYVPELIDNGGASATWEKLFNDKEKSNITCMIATYNNEPVGFVTYLMHEFPLNWPRCYLSDLYVKRNFRRMGIAKMMLEHVIKYIKDSKIKNSGIYWVTENTNDAARALYDKYAVQEFVRYDIYNEGESNV